MLLVSSEKDGALAGRRDSGSGARGAGDTAKPTLERGCESSTGRRPVFLEAITGVANPVHTQLTEFQTRSAGVSIVNRYRITFRCRCCDCRILMAVLRAVRQAECDGYPAKRRRYPGGSNAGMVQA
jgi:hypothetical protein